jgi:LmbE family N-acetylglucosaminyl deacetylase
MSTIKTTFVASFILLSAVMSSLADAALYIAAHPDDIEYLMARDAQSDVRSNNPTVFVLLTAGDAANGAEPAGNTKDVPYYRARLKAHELSVRFWQGLDPNSAAPLPTYSTELIKGQSVETVTMGNVVLYNLNLPDNGTLRQLSEGTIPSVTSISPINTYTLAQVKDVIREIIRINNPAMATVNVHTSDPDPAWNSGDHPDHLATGAIVSAAITEDAAYRCVNRFFYMGYSVGGHAQSYSQDELDIQVATIGVLNGGLIDNGNKSTWDQFHNGFFGKMNNRRIMSRGSCSF